ncbi:MAG: Gfo/Idh/MocA family oxidoreductase, partial [Armatimonadota bacterium]
MKTDLQLPVLVVGGGMISEEVVLPTLFQERRRHRAGDIAVASRRAATILRLRDVFPDETFRCYPDPERVAPEDSRPEEYKQAIAELPAPGIVVVATPDHLHTPVVMAAIKAGHHCVVQKPLCLKVSEAHDIAAAAHERGAYVYTDYHKRHDRAIRAARYRFRKGDLGQMLHGHAWIEERREIPLKWFARWCEQSSSFEYIGVHYVDAYYFITGLRPRRVVAFAQKKLLPTLGKDAFDAVQATIEWEDDSVLWVQTAWVCSEHQSALTNQGLNLLGTEGEYWADHKNRNLLFVTQSGGFEHYNPNFFKTYDDWNSPDQPEYVGYGYDSIMQGVNDIRAIAAATRGLPADDALAKRRDMIAAL